MWRRICPALWVVLLLQTATAGATIIESANITSNTTWTASDVHLVTAMITVVSGVTLTVQPGTVVKFQAGAGISVNQGVLYAVGSDTEPIVFTSYRDDTVGGDTNGGGASTGAPGDWGRLDFADSVIDFLTRLEQVEVRYGGSGNQGSIYLYQANVAVVDSVVRDGSSHGIYTYQSSPLLTGNTVTGNAAHGLYHYGASSPVDRGNTVSGNQSGIYSQYATPTVEGNTIADNREWGLYHLDARNAPVITGNTITGNLRGAMLPASVVPNSGDGNVLAPNQINALWIRGMARAADLRLEVLDAGTDHELGVYQIDGILTVNAGVTLTVDPRVVVKFSGGAGLDVDGALWAVGTAAAPVAFTSWRDDGYGGDLNLDGTASAPANGDWRGISFSNLATDAGCRLEQVVVRYGGSANNAAVYAYQTDLALVDSEIAHSSTSGVRGYQSNLTLTGNELYANRWNGVNLESTGTTAVSGGRIYANQGDGIAVAHQGVLTVSGAEIFGNTGYGVRSSSTGAVAATGTWWGAADGPGGSGPGTGDEVTANVTASAFLTTGSSFGYFNAGPNTSEGPLAAVATQGTDSTEWGTSAPTRVLYDLERVILDYPVLEPAKRYDLYVTYLNNDDTAGIGGNLQRLVDGNDQAIHGRQAVPATTPVQYPYALPPAAYGAGTLRLQFVRDNGYRAAVSQVWLVEEQTAGDSAAPVSSVTFPAAGAHLTGGLVEVAGTASDGAGSGVASVEVGVDTGAGPTWRPVTAFGSDGRWTYRWTLPADGSVTLTSRATDRVGNREAPGAGVAAVVNQTPPAAATGLSTTDTEADAGGSVSLYWTLSVDDGAGANDVTGYTVERGTTAGGPFALVGSAAAGVGTIADATTVDATLYYYRVVAADQAGNRTTSAVYGPVISINNTVPDATPPEEVTGLTATPGNGFVYLRWTRSLDTARDLLDQFLDVSADAGATWGTATSLGKEANFRLVAGLTNDTPYQFRLRVNDTANPANTSTGVVVSATPRATAVTTVSGALAADTTWAAGVYRVTGTVTVNAGVTLTIAPGVIVKFGAGTGLTVRGGLQAVGTAGSPVAFTAWTDDVFGGDSNGDGATTAGTRGYWDRLYFENAAASRLEQVVVRYGGSSSQGSVHLNQSAVPVLASRIEEGSSHGIYTYNCSPLLQGNTLADNGGDGLRHYGAFSPVDRGNAIERNQNGIYSQYATPVIDANTIADNAAYGIYHVDARAAGELTGNTVTGNAKPVRLPFSSLPNAAAGNTLTGNANDQIEFYGNTLTRNLTLPALPANTAYYQVSGNANVATGVKLTVAPGVVWKVGGGATIDVNGALAAVGTEGQKIVFTSYRDDTVGGDTNGGGASTGAPGDWGRLDFADSVIDFLTRLEQVEVRYGGSGNQGSIYLYQANVAVVDSVVRDGSSHGIYTYQSSPLLTGNTVTGNAAHGLYHYGASSPVDRGNTVSGNQSGIYSQYATPTVEGNTIADNREWGLYHLDARNAPVITGNTITGNLRGAMLPASVVPNSGDGNVLAPNQINALWIRGMARAADLRLEVLDAGTDHELGVYQIDGILTVNAGVTLTVDPRVVVKFSGGAGLDVDGALWAVGTAAAPVAFTSWRDDGYGGDLNLDGTASAPANGDWRGISFSNLATDAGCRLEQVVVRYGGSANNAAVYAYQTDLALVDSEIAHSSTSGVRGYQSNLTLTGNELYANRWNGVNLESTGTTAVSGGRIYANQGDGIAVAHQGVLTVSGAEIFGNTGYGVRSSSTGAVAATGTWWGAADGPGGSGPGTGDEVTANMAATDFLTDGSEYSFYDAGGSAHSGYGIASPYVTGLASTEWGTAPAQSFAYSIDPKQLVAEYVGLAPTASYRLLVTYLNNDAGGGVQTLTATNGEVLHGALSLPTGSPVPYAYPVPATAVAGETLALHLNAVSGLRAVVSGLFLVRNAVLDQTAPVVHLAAPGSGEILRSETRNISGTAADPDSGLHGVEVGIRLATGERNWVPVTVLTSDGTWSYRWSAQASGEYSLMARATDRSGNQALAPEEALVTVDGAAPQPITGLFVQGLSGAAGTMRLTWLPSADDGTGAGDVVGYAVYRAPGPLAAFTQVGQLAAGASRFDDLTVLADTDYHYRVRTLDRAGNTADSGTFGPVRASGATDTTPPEDVTNLVAAATQVAGGSPSVFLSWTGSANTAGDLVDQLLYISANGALFGNNPPAYDNGQPRRLGRTARNHHEGGLTAGVGYTFKLAVVDGVPNESPGTTASITPTGAPNQVVALSGTLPTETALGAGVYRLAGLTVPAGTTLTLGPGAVLKFEQSRALVVQGTLLAVGTAGNPVVFTAWTDDTAGGDSNGDGSATAGTPGYWDRVYLENSPTSRLEQVAVRFGGSSSQGSVHLFQSNAQVLSSQITDGSSHGVYTYNGSPLLQGNTVADHGGNGLHHYGASSPADRGNTITGNQNGVYSQYATPTIDANTIADNRDWGVIFTDYRAAPPLTGNTITGNRTSLQVPACALPDATNLLAPNTRNLIAVFGGDIGADKHLPVWGKGTAEEVSTYVITGTLEIPAYRFLTVDPGVTLKFAAGSGVRVDGALVAEGTAAEKIAFTSVKDDAYGGDTNGNGTATWPVNGDWNGIAFYNSFFESASRLKQALVRYAGAANSAAVYLENADIAIAETEVANSASHGLRAYGGAPVFTGNTLWGNRGDGIRLESNASAAIAFNRISTNLSDGIELVNSARATATNNQLFQNRGYGILNGGGTLLDATQTWWGDATGPYHPTANAGGLGNRVSDNVTFAPFDTGSGTPHAYRNFSATAGTTAGTLPLPTLTQGTLSDEWDPATKSPDKTMAWDNGEVILDYAGLDPAKVYRVRVSYFNGDAGGSLQSLLTGTGAVLHGSMAMPATPFQYEFSLPTAAYADGNLKLRFIHDNPATSFKAAVPELWLLEDLPENVPPRFEAVAYDDRDGSGGYSVGDELHFRFSEEMEASGLQDDTTDANAKLAVAGGLIYGTVNQSRWLPDGRTVVVTLTEGFTVAGGETVAPTGLTDRTGNSVVGSQNLPTADRVAPAFAGIDWEDVDGSASLSLGDRYVFRFGEAMRAAAVKDQTQDANALLRPAGGARYGSVNTVAWAPDTRSVTVTVTAGYTVLGDELVVPSPFVTDVAGNPVTGTQVLSGIDRTPPLLAAILFDDRDGSGATSVGDRYFFRFNEPMRGAALSDNSVEANLNLSPAGQTYGEVNRIAWNGDFTEAVVELTAGFTVVGNEVVSPSALLTDKAGNPVANTGGLTLADTVAPAVVRVQANYVSPVSAVANYRLTVQFDSAMNPAALPAVQLTTTGAVQPSVPDGGTWLTTRFPGDTYSTPA
ncbi:MAG: right-handed parallel beta-helix repeat-containing protein, partial [Deferrisomatales bacterium]|nr:right-handed parallel beta-helix repeat-containing protein [Deferrisomatales bacterium]